MAEAALTPRTHLLLYYSLRNIPVFLSTLVLRGLTAFPSLLLLRLWHCCFTNVWESQEVAELTGRSLSNVTGSSQETRSLSTTNSA